MALLAGQLWLGAAGPDLTPESMPRVPPREPAQALRSFELRPGFHAELLAAEPLVASPVAIAVDESGAAFVVEMRDYSERRPEALGRVRRLTDTDGDGIYDHATVFLDHLPWPTAVTCWDGGVFLGATPDLIFAKDIDNDGVADVREVVFTGFAQRYAPFATNQLNVQALLNSLQWGPHQRIHGATSMSGGEVRRVDSPFTQQWRKRYQTRPSSSPATESTAPVSLSGRDFSFDPRSLQLRAEPGGGQHGMSFDSDGRKFVCSNSDHLQWIAFNDLAAPANPYHDLGSPRRSIAADGAAAEVFRRSPDEPWRVLRTRWRVAGVVEGMVEGGGRPSGYFTGATGVTLYRGDAYGPDFAGDAFIADCGSNLIHRKKIRRASDGSGLIGERAPDEARREFLASTDNWFRPVQFYNAPDGCLWVVDMYRETIEHPWSIPPRLKEHLDLDSGRERGRLWRLTPDAGTGPVKARYVGRNSSARELAQLLAHPNGWHREIAARLLHERQDSSVVPELLRVAKESPSAHGRRLALSVLVAENQLDDATLAHALQDSDPAVRAEAFRQVRTRLATPSAGTNWPAVLQPAAEREAQEEVLVEIAFALDAPTVTPTQRATAVATLLRSPKTMVRSAALHAANGTEFELWTAEIRTNRTGSITVLRELTTVLGRRANPADIASIAKILIAHRPMEASRQLGTALAEGLARSGKKLADFISAQELQTWFNPALEELAQTNADNTAVQLLAWDARPETGARLLKRLAIAPEAQVPALLAALRQHPVLVTNASLLRETWTATPKSRHSALTDLWLRSAQGARTLLATAAEPKRAVDPTTWTPSQVAALRGHSAADVREQARRLLGDPPASRQAVIETFSPALSERGDPVRGATIFQERCATCHAFRGRGIALGPDLASVAANGPEKLLVAILDPNRDVAPQFAAWTAETVDGETVTGIKVQDSDTSVTLRQAGGVELTMDRPRLRSFESAGRSLMPEGLEQGWTSSDLAGLLTFLTSDETGRSLVLHSTTVAGNGRNSRDRRVGDGGPGVAAELANPFGVVRGPDGALWFCEYDGHRIRRLDPSGTLTTFAGTGAAGYTGDGGPAHAATFNQPHEIRFDASGNLYVADMRNHAIRRVDRQTGTITTIAGNGQSGYSGDGGPAISAQLRQPHSLQFDPQGNLFICDIGNHVIRRVDSRSGIISTFAGTGRPGPTPDGAPISGTPLNGPRSLDFDSRGNLWLATREGNQVFRFDLSSGTIHHAAGTGAKGFSGNGGPARTATLSGPKGISVAGNGDVYLADTESHSIRKLSAQTGHLELVVGTGEAGDGPDGDARSCRLNRPHGIWLDPDGTLYIGDSENHRIRKVSR